VSGETPTLATAAAEYAAQGMPIFPLLPRAKQPFGGSHSCSAPTHQHGLDDATSDARTVREWWTAHPGANIGMATGRGVDVLDVDGPTGEESLAALVARRWPLPATVEVKTSRGRHIYFLAGGWPCGASRLAPKLDTRGRGGYVLLPPSVHPDGSIYAWSGEKECAAAPAWLTQLLLRPVVAPSPPRPVVRHRSRYAEAALESATATVRTTPEGKRNETLNREAFGIGQLVAAGAINAGDAEDELVDAAMSAGLPESEARRTTLGALKDGASSPRSGLGSAT
jgi:hypothetical protein